MVYYIGKFFQFLGLTVILFGFVSRFPELMSYKTLLIGAAYFAMGWLIERFMVKK